MKKIFTLFFAAMLIAPTWALNYNIVKEETEGNMVKLTINYQSVGADEVSAVTVSGIVTYPSSKKAVAIIMDNHFTITKDAEAPSNETPSVITNSVFNMGGTYCFTSADYLGYGLTRDQVHTYLCQRQNAINSIDLMKVAREIFAERGIELQNDVFVNTGYSQGGGVTMAVHREMELNKELAEELHFAGSFCGAGPYDLVATMEWYLSQTKLNTPSLMPLVIRGMLAGGFLPGYEYKDFFVSEAMANDLAAAIDGKELSLSGISDVIKTHTGGQTAAKYILHKDMMDNTTTIHKDFMKAAKLNSLLEGWQPTFPVHVCHYELDSVVPAVNAHNAIEALNLDEDHYSIAPTTIVSNHSDFAIYYYRYIFLGKLTSMINDYGKPQGVENVRDGIFNNGVIYNILGMPVDENYHGIVIVDGVKKLQ